MKIDNMMLGALEEIVLLCILLLGDDAYSKRINDEIELRFNKKTSMGAIHMSLSRMMNKGYITFYKSEITNKKGGKSRKIYEVTDFGAQVLDSFMGKKAQIWGEVRLLS